jgi:hypothetical protein
MQPPLFIVRFDETSCGRNPPKKNPPGEVRERKPTSNQTKKHLLMAPMQYQTHYDSKLKHDPRWE